MQTALWKRLSQDLGARQTRAQTLDEPADSPVYDRDSSLDGSMFIHRAKPSLSIAPGSRESNRL